VGLFPSGRVRADLNSQQPLKRLFPGGVRADLGHLRIMMMHGGIMPLSMLLPGTCHQFLLASPSHDKQSSASTGSPGSLEIWAGDGSSFDGSKVVYHYRYGVEAPLSWMSLQIFHQPTNQSNFSHYRYVSALFSPPKIHASGLHSYGVEYVINTRY